HYAYQKKRRVLASELGLQVFDFLYAHLTLIFDLRFTATMELALDRVATAELDSKQFLQTFGETLQPLLVPWQEASKADLAETTEVERCPLCQDGHLRLKKSKRGTFWGCSRFPDCRFIRDSGESPRKIGQSCPNCAAPMLLK